MRSDELHRRENLLLKRWKRVIGPDFHPDGAVDARNYSKSKPKLLFILKEVNNPKEPVFDLRELLRKWKWWRPATPPMVARWSGGLIEGISWDRVYDADEKCIRKWLSGIAWINLNKGRGGSRCKSSDLRETVRKSAKFIREHIALLDPELVVCGGREIGDLVLEEIYPEDSTKWRWIRKPLVSYLPRHKARPAMLETYHPGQSTVKARRLFETLVDAARALRLV